MEQQVAWQVFLETAPEPVDCARGRIGQSTLVVPVVRALSPARCLFGPPPQTLVRDRDQARRPPAGVVVHPRHGRRMVRFALPVLVVVAEVHLHGDLPTTHVLRELAVDVSAGDAPVEVVAVREFELIRQIHLNCRSEVCLLRLRKLLVRPAARSLSIEQLVQRVAQRPTEPPSRVRLLLEPGHDLGKVGWARLLEGPAERPGPWNLAHRIRGCGVRSERVAAPTNGPGSGVLARRSGLVLERQRVLVHSGSLSGPPCPTHASQAMKGRTCFAIARARPDGTAFPICFAIAVFVPTQR